MWNLFMNKNPTIKKRLHPGVKVGFWILISLGILNFPAHGKPSGPGESRPLAPEAYTFQIVLKPGVDTAIQVKSLPKKEDKKDGGAAPPMPAVTKIIRRDIRPGLVRVSESFGGGKETVRYYVDGWCVYDDPRRGLNVRAQSIEGSIFPMSSYHFPELLWADPKTLQPDPIVKEGAPKIQLYALGKLVLEVDAVSKRPMRFQDGENEWTYSYKENTTPIVIPAQLEAALRRVVPKH